MKNTTDIHFPSPELKKMHDTEEFEISDGDEDCGLAESVYDIEKKTIVDLLDKRYVLYIPIILDCAEKILSNRALSFLTVNVKSQCNGIGQCFIKYVREKMFSKDQKYMKIGEAQKQALQKCSNILRRGEEVSVIPQNILDIFDSQLSLDRIIDIDQLGNIGTASDRNLAHVLNYTLKFSRAFDQMIQPIISMPIISALIPFDIDFVTNYIEDFIEIISEYLCKLFEENESLRNGEGFVQSVKQICAAEQFFAKRLQIVLVLIYKNITPVFFDMCSLAQQWLAGLIPTKTVQKCFEICLKNKDHAEKNISKNLALEAKNWLMKNMEELRIDWDMDIEQCRKYIIEIGDDTRQYVERQKDVVGDQVTHIVSLLELFGMQMYDEMKDQQQLDNILNLTQKGELFTEGFRIICDFCSQNMQKFGMNISGEDIIERLFKYVQNGEEKEGEEDWEDDDENDSNSDADDI